MLPEGISYDRENGFGTARLGLIYELNRRSEGQKSPVVDLKGIDWNQLLRELREFKRVEALTNSL